MYNVTTDFVPPAVLIVSCILHVHVTTDFVPPMVLIVSCTRTCTMYMYMYNVHVHVTTDLLAPAYYNNCIT